jgi:putative ABC transport system permease protein
MQLFGIFAVLAVILAGVGIYGVMSFSVERRSHEIGVRMAMGAERHNVLGLVIRHGLKLVAIGLVIGIGASFWLTRFIAGFLYGVSSHDPLTFVVVSVVLVAVTLLACWIPARWATRVDPVVALRYE